MISILHYGFKDVQPVDGSKDFAKELSSPWSESQALFKHYQQ
jgi:hypothetical protein